MRVPAADLRSQHDSLRDELFAAWARLLDSSAFINGPEVEAFEREFATYCGVKHCIGLANGTEALALALRAVEVGAGDSVVVPAFTFAATIEAVCHVGARPLLADIDNTSFALDPVALRDVIRAEGGRVAAILPVHLYGQIVEMDEINAIASAAGAKVIEDAAQAHGALYHGRKAGSLATAACFSFYPTKNLGGLGDGGACTTDSDAVAGRLRMLRDHGQSAKYVHQIVGYNSRLDAFQAAALRVKLPHLDAWNARRRQIAARYMVQLAGVPGVSLPLTLPHRQHVYHLFVIRVPERDSLRQHLDAQGIATSIHYPVPLHEQSAFRAMATGRYPNAEAAAREVVALPMFSELSDEAVDTVCAAIRAWAKA